MLDQPVFAISGRDYSCGDLLLAAMWWRQWPAFERYVLEGWACAQFAAQRGIDDEEQIALAATEFRYARDLISAAETESWLVQAGLTVDAWMESITRAARRASQAAHRTEALSKFPPSAENVDGVLVPDGFCSGAFESIAVTLAGRAAVMISGPRVEFDARRDATVDEVCAQYAGYFARWGMADARERIANIASIDSGYEHVINEAATPEALLARVQDNQLDWMRVELETLTLASEHAAREARLCCREDGVSLTQMGGEIRVQSQRRTLLLEDAADALRPVLLSAPPGEILEPIAVETGFQLLTVVRKSPPALGHEDVEARARAVIVKTITDRELANQGSMVGPVLMTYRVANSEQRIANSEW